MERTDNWIKVGGGIFLGILMVVLFGEYVWPLVAAIMGLTGIGIAVFLIWDGLIDMEL